MIFNSYVRCFSTLALAGLSAAAAPVPAAQTPPSMM
ncbi:MAG: hypothetical protein QOH86_728, partial [Sphingomonadales bacterium]|nr:hypothetical protein [Sphingomonadales bacterium]